MSDRPSKKRIKIAPPTQEGRGNPIRLSQPPKPSQTFAFPSNSQQLAFGALRTPPRDRRGPDGGIRCAASTGGVKRVPPGEGITSDKTNTSPAEASDICLDQRSLTIDGSPPLLPNPLPIRLGLSADEENGSESDEDSYAIFLEGVLDDEIPFYPLTPTMFVVPGWNRKSLTCNVSLFIISEMKTDSTFRNNGIISK